MRFQNAIVILSSFATVSLLGFLAGIGEAWDNESAAILSVGLIAGLLVARSKKSFANMIIASLTMLVTPIALAMVRKIVENPEEHDMESLLIASSIFLWLLGPILAWLAFNALVWSFLYYLERSRRKAL